MSIQKGGAVSLSEGLLHKRHHFGKVPWVYNLTIYLCRFLCLSQAGFQEFIQILFRSLIGKGCLRKYLIRIAGDLNSPFSYCLIRRDNSCLVMHA